MKFASRDGVVEVMKEGASLVETKCASKENAQKKRMAGPKKVRKLRRGIPVRKREASAGRRVRLRGSGRRPRRASALETWVERFGRRGTEPNELFRSKFGQNSWHPKQTTGGSVAKKNHFNEAAFDPKYKKGPHGWKENGNNLH